jgi:hypothetical protein
MRHVAIAETVHTSGFQKYFSCSFPGTGMRAGLPKLPSGSHNALSASTSAYTYYVGVGAALRREASWFLTDRTSDVGLLRLQVAGDRFVQSPLR